jgi:magnesium transporter
MMTQGIPWPAAYAGFVIGSAIVGWLTFQILRYIERRKAQRSLAAAGKVAAG